MNTDVTKSFSVRCCASTLETLVFKALRKLEVPAYAPVRFRRDVEEFELGIDALRAALTVNESWRVDSSGGYVEYTVVDSRLTLYLRHENPDVVFLRTIASEDSRFYFQPFEHPWFSFASMDSSLAITSERYYDRDDREELLEEALEHVGSDVTIAWSDPAIPTIATTHEDAFHIATAFPKAPMVIVDRSRGVCVSDQNGRITLSGAPSIAPAVRFEMGGKTPYRRDVSTAFVAIPAHCDFYTEARFGQLFLFHDHHFVFVPATPFDAKIKPDWSALLSCEAETFACELFHASDFAVLEPNRIEGAYSSPVASDFEVMNLLRRWTDEGAARGGWHHCSIWPGLRVNGRPAHDALVIHGDTIRSDGDFIYALNEALFGTGCFYSTDRWIVEDCRFHPGTPLFWQDFDQSVDAMTPHGLADAVEFLTRFDVSVDGRWSSYSEFRSWLVDALGPRTRW